MYVCSHSIFVVKICIFIVFITIPLLYVMSYLFICNYFDIGYIFSEVFLSIIRNTYIGVGEGEGLHDPP